MKFIVYVAIFSIVLVSFDSRTIKPLDKSKYREILRRYYLESENTKRPTITTDSYDDYGRVITGTFPVSVPNTEATTSYVTESVAAIERTYNLEKENIFAHQQICFHGGIPKTKPIDWIDGMTKCVDTFAEFVTETELTTKPISRSCEACIKDFETCVEGGVISDIKHCFNDEDNLVYLMKDIHRQFAKSVCEENVGNCIDMKSGNSYWQPLLIVVLLAMAFFGVVLIICKTKQTAIENV